MYILYVEKQSWAGQRDEKPMRRAEASLNQLFLHQKSLAMANSNAGAPRKKKTKELTNEQRIGAVSMLLVMVWVKEAHVVGLRLLLKLVLRSIECRRHHALLLNIAFFFLLLFTPVLLPSLFELREGRVVPVLHVKRKAKGTAA